MDKALLERVTLGGKVPLPDNANLNEAKLVAADQIYTGVKHGDPFALAEFKTRFGARLGETLTTGDDFIYAFQHLLNVDVATEWEARTRTWEEAIPTREVDTFDEVKVYSIDPSVGGFARPVTEPGKPAHVPPVVPEGSPYPRFTFKGEVAAGGRLHKAGGEFGVTFERIISDAGRIVPQLPGIITEFLHDREEWDAWNSLFTFLGAPQKLVGGRTLDGETVIPDAPLSRAALALGIQQLKQRKAGDRYLGVKDITLVVGVGMAEQAHFYINNISLDSIQDGSRKLNVSGYNPLSSITKVVESEYIPSDASWYLIPTKGTLGANRGASFRFVELGRLSNHVGPEVRVEDVTGNYWNGGAVAPFEGSFKTDDAALRGRIISGGLQWNPDFGLWSDGTGTP